MRTLILLILTVSRAINETNSIRLSKRNHGSLGAPAGAEDVPLPPAQWFLQKLDHNNPSNLRTWKQRYFVNNQFYDGASSRPMFLMIGGEGPADARWMVKGAWIEYAETFKALCFQLEHRFYGESHPTGDTSVKNLQYLSSIQALEDLAYFISSMNIKYRLASNVQWVVFGGSYPGALAAWARMKYPHLVFAAISSSGPLLAKLNFQEYFVAVEASIREKTGDDECIHAIKTAHKQIELYMSLDRKKVEEEFSVCAPFSNSTRTSDNDIRNFYSLMADNFANLVQYNEDNRISGDIQYKDVTVNTVCNNLTQGGAGMAYKNLGQFNALMLRKNNETCLDYSYNTMINDLRNSTWGPNSGRQWLWQTCTEFGFYQTSSEVVDMFGNDFPLEFFVQQCQDIFGQKYDKEFITAAVDWTNNKYGALNVMASRVIFVHGSIDPWHILGITKTKNRLSPAIYIHGTAHCANMYPSTEKDPKALVEAREQIRSHLSSWIDFP